MGPTGPAGESQMVRAKGEMGTIGLVCPGGWLLNQWGLISLSGFLPCPPQQHLFPLCSPSPAPAGRPIISLVLSTLQFRI